MSRNVYAFVCILIVLGFSLMGAGCVGGPGPGTPTLTATPAQTPTATPAETPAATVTVTLTMTTTATSTGTPAATLNATPNATPTANAVTVSITAKNFAFSTNSITAPRGAQVTVSFDNQDQGIPHNVAFYTSAAATQSIYKGQIVTGPAQSTFTFTAPSTPGTYFFRCDVHPQMSGNFVVT